MDHRLQIPHSHWGLNRLEWTLKTHAANRKGTFDSSISDFSRCVNTVAYFWKKFGQQHYLVEPSLIPLFKATNFDALNLEHLQWPFDSFLLVLPKTEDVMNILVAREKDNVAFLLGHKEGFSCYVESNFSKIKNELKEERNPEILNPVTNKDRNPQKPSADWMNKEGTSMYVRMAFSCLAFMNAKPEHIWQDPSPIRFPKKHKTDQRPWIPVKWLGKSYASHIQSSSPASDNPTYHVAAHWRRGHWRTQHYGPKTENLTKVIWIEPVFIGV